MNEATSRVPVSGALRVIDFGRASPLRSQTLWHAVAHGVSEGAPPTLSFVRPGAPYVSIGLLRHLDEVDLDYCAKAGLPVYRRMVGGGPVYLDADQLFFQITVPLDRVPASRAEALRALLGPAVAAFREQGVAAALDADQEITLGDRKICGHGAGQIEGAVVVVGNLIERFDHERAARILRVPDRATRAEILRLMRRYVAATPICAERFKDAAVRAYADALGLAPVTGTLAAAEEGHLTNLDLLFETDAWLRGPDRPRTGVRQAKIRGGVRVCVARHAGARVVAAIVHGRLESVRLADPDLDGLRGAVEQAILGLSLDDALKRLDEFGEPGRRLATALALVSRHAS